MRGLPISIGHAVHRFAACRLVDPGGFGDPIAQAVATKSRQPHQVDILRIGAVLQVADKAAKRGSGGGIINLINHHGHKSSLAGVSWPPSNR